MGEVYRARDPRMVFGCDVRRRRASTIRVGSVADGADIDNMT